MAPGHGRRHARIYYGQPSPATPVTRQRTPSDEASALG